MGETDISSNSHNISEGRSRVFYLLASAFRYPTADSYQQLLDGEYLGKLYGEMALLPHTGVTEKKRDKLLVLAQKAMKNLSYDDFQAQFICIFETGAPNPPCPPYEGFCHKGTPRNATMLKITEFYKHFGLQMNQAEDNREMPDHISAELEFLHFLTFKEAQAREEGDTDLLQGYILAQRDFLFRHPLQWVPFFAEKISKADPNSIFSILAELTADFIQRESKLTQRYLDELGVTDEGPGVPPAKVQVISGLESGGAGCSCGPIVEGD